MYRKTEPKNKNITIRVTESEKFEFLEIAKMHELSISELANHILSKHKNSYGKTENTKMLIQGIDLTIENMEAVIEVLKTLQKEYESFYQKTSSLILLEMNILKRIIEFTTFKRQIQG